MTTPKGIVFSRVPGIPKEAPYEERFANLFILTSELKDAVETVLIMLPQELGDTYDEVMRSLELIGDANMTLTVMPSQMRKSGLAQAFRGMIG